MSGCRSMHRQDKTHMPYVVRADPQKAFRNLLLNTIQWAAVIGVTLGFALFLWTITK